MSSCTSDIISLKCDKIYPVLTLQTLKGYQNGCVIWFI